MKSYKTKIRKNLSKQWINKKYYLIAYFFIYHESKITLNVIYYLKIFNKTWSLLKSYYFKNQLSYREIQLSPNVILLSISMKKIKCE